jgi:hypothetical protein
MDGELRKGWDYLREKFLGRALQDPNWTSPSFWAKLTPHDLSGLYVDDTLGEGCKDKIKDVGKTLNRVNERAFLINDLGNHLTELNCKYIRELFEQCDKTLGGSDGFLNALKSFEAYSDPVRKKSLFFSSIAKSECKWNVKDQENLASPVDYHELRGHLRIGTLIINDSELSARVQSGLAITEKEDTELRQQAQKVNDRIGKETGCGSSAIHYLFWYVFRNCCPRASAQTHCLNCGDGCELLQVYKQMPTYHDRCVFSEVCNSANKPDKVIDPAYIGHFY